MSTTANAHGTTTATSGQGYPTRRISTETKASFKTTELVA